MSTELASIKPQLQFTPEQIELIKRTIAYGTTDDELQLFLYQCKRTQLDPLTRQIYCIKRRTWNKELNRYDEKMSIQTSIDGFRLIAARSGNYAGQSEPRFEYEKDSKIPYKCSLTVYCFGPNGQRYEAAIGIAYWSEYVGEKVPMMWMKMPHAMLAKTAESLALRKAFPQEMSGLYTSEEMAEIETKDEDETRTEMVRNIAMNTPNQPIPYEEEEGYDCSVCNGKAKKIKGTSKKTGKPYQMIKCLENKDHAFFPSTDEYKKSIKNKENKETKEVIQAIEDIPLPPLPPEEEIKPEDIPF